MKLLTICLIFYLLTISVVTIDASEAHEGENTLL